MIKKIKGFTLIEVILVLGFAAVLIGSAFLAYSVIKDKSMVNKEVQTISTVLSNIETYYYYANDYTTLSGITVDQLFPENAIGNSTVSAVHRLGPFPFNNIRYFGSGPSYRIVYYHVYEKYCVPFVSLAAQSFDQVTVDDATPLVSTNAIVKERGKALDVEKLVEICNQDTDSGSYGRYSISFLNYF